MVQNKIISILYDPYYSGKIINILHGVSKLLTKLCVFCVPAFMDSPQVHAGKGGTTLVFRQESEEQPRDTPWNWPMTPPLLPDRPEE